MATKRKTSAKKKKPGSKLKRATAAKRKPATKKTFRRKKPVEKPVERLTTKISGAFRAVVDTLSDAEQLNHTMVRSKLATEPE